jgi:hypothetical protein
MSAFGRKRIAIDLNHIRFSNRPFWVKCFQTYPPLQR